MELEMMQSLRVYGILFSKHIGHGEAVTLHLFCWISCISCNLGQVYKSLCSSGGVSEAIVQHSFQCCHRGIKYDACSVCILGIFILMCKRLWMMLAGTESKDNALYQCACIHFVCIQYDKTRNAVFCSRHTKAQPLCMTVDGLYFLSYKDTV